MHKYQIEKQIGKGSYGKVYICRRTEDRKRFVMKKISIKEMSPKEKQSTRQEVALLQSLQHPNIVGYKDSFLTNNDKDLCIVMTHCEGGDLHSRIQEFKGSKLPEKQIMKWFTQILLAVDFLHSRKVLHRDLKTQNIFLTKDGTIQLGDFGIARVFERTLDMAKTSIGTPLYMSPEVCNNKPYSYKSDIWSLGCILYEMCAGRPPFNANDLRSLFMKITGGIYTPIPYVYSSKMQELVRKTLYTNPHRRPSIAQILNSSYVKQSAMAYIAKVLKDCPANDVSSSDLNHTMILIRNESTNIKIQARELGYDLNEIMSLGAPEESTSSEPKESKPKPRPSLSGQVSQASNVSRDPPKKEIVLNKNRVPISDVQSAVSKLSKMEAEKRLVKEEILKLRNRNRDNHHNLASENEKRRAALIQRKREQEDAILEKQRKRQLAAEDRRLRIKQGLAIVPKYSKVPNQTPKSIPSKDITPSVSGRKDDINKAKINKIEERKQELYKYYEKKMQLEKEIQNIEQGIQRGVPISKGNSDEYREHIKQLAQQDYIAPPKDFSGLSHKDKILKKKELSKLQKNQEELDLLQKARNENYSRRLQAKNMEYNQYHGPSPPKRGSVVDESLQKLLPKHDRYVENEKFLQKQDDRRKAEDNDDNIEVDQVKLQALEQAYLSKKREVNELRKTLTMAYGKSVDELKFIAESQQNKPKRTVVEDDDEDDDDNITDDDLESDDESEDSDEEEVEDPHMIGRLEDRIMRQKERCIQHIGESTFKKLYRAYKEELIPRNDPSAYGAIIKLIGRCENEYIVLMEALLFMEDSLNT